MLPWYRPNLCDEAGQDVKRMGSAFSEARAFELSAIREAIKDEMGITQAGLDANPVERERWAVKILSKIEDIKDAQRAKFSKEEQKDLESVDRRGIESAVEYELRREEGLEEKNERDDPNSSYSQDAIEDGLMLREAQNGVEYGAMWSAKGELIQIAKGDKGSVSCYSGDDACKDGTFTHSHPTNEDEERAHGLSFSADDLVSHGSRNLAETRAVAVEGKYSLVARKEDVRLPPDVEREIRQDPKLGKIYDGSLEGRQRLTMQVLARKMSDKNPNAPINRAIQEITAIRHREMVAERVKLQNEQNPTLTFRPSDVAPYVRAPSPKEVMTDPRFLARQNQYVAEAMREVGATYTFTPNKGYEFMNDPKAMTRKGLRETASFPHRESRIDKDGNTTKKEKASAPKSATEAVKKMSPKKEPKPKPATDLKTSPPPLKQVAEPSPKPTPPQSGGGSLSMGGQRGITRFGRLPI